MVRRIKNSISKHKEMRGLKVILLCMSWALVACSPDSSRPIIPEDTMAEILIDQYLIQSAAVQRPVEKPDKVTFYYAHILKKYNYTEAEFDSSVVWYTSHMDVYEKVYDKVMKRLQTLEDSCMSVVTSSSAQ